SGVVLELRRKDDGRPVWIEWWSRPAAGSKYLRTMFIDVTDRVLLEREKARLEAALREANARLAQSEEQFRDLFEEAPIAYVHQGIDARILRANRTAMKILGVKPGEIEGMEGPSFWSDTPEAQRRGREALPMLATGTDEKGVVLELRRKDDGRPLWVRWWCRPEPGGNYTRS